LGGLRRSVPQKIIHMEIKKYPYIGAAESIMDSASQVKDKYEGRELLDSTWHEVLIRHGCRRSGLGSKVKRKEQWNCVPTKCSERTKKRILRSRGFVSGLGEHHIKRFVQAKSTSGIQGHR